MADTAKSGQKGEQEGGGGHGEQHTRRDFLYLTTGAMGVVGLAAVAWPFIDYLNPSADLMELATVDVDLSPVDAGMAITVMWQGKPVFVRRRTEEEIAQAREVDVNALPHSESDEERVQREEWLIVIGICTHLGCVPVGNRPTEQRGDYGGWFCPCHGSHYDTSGRIRRGPAPENLPVPEYEFVDDSTITIG